MSHKVLVTGGAGFLGSHLCEQLLSAGQEVYCLDNFSSGRRHNITSFEGNDSFHLMDRDVRTPSSLPQIDRIYHLASRASPADFQEYPVQIALANTQGTRQLLDHARACGARILFASTSEVYGDPEVHPQPETYNGNVNIRGIRGCYDESKRFGETLAVAYRRKYDIDARAVRIFNTYGPRMRPDDGRVIPTFINQALNDEDLTVYGDGEQTRSFCYVDDLVDGLISVMNHSNPNYDVYNIGRANERTILELAEEITELIETNSGIVFEPLPEDDPTRRKPDLSRVHNDIGWYPEIDLSSGLENTISYFQEHEE
ncbi:UDP-glucuronic acid decarboxylase family protein [Haloarchaeobius amylolyticus]|uniref:UDP-glucuronic acid decarboxylase family protein n=1 Tax=Haloarchaeobius amylolyticus TaxID=1198296 RepID=A0ABD6BCZ6_9EURY